MACILFLVYLVTRDTIIFGDADFTQYSSKNDIACVVLIYMFKNLLSTK